MPQFLITLLLSGKTGSETVTQQRKGVRENLAGTENVPDTFSLFLQDALEKITDALVALQAKGQTS